MVPRNDTDLLGREYTRRKLSYNQHDFSMCSDNIVKANGNQQGSRCVWGGTHKGRGEFARALTFLRFERSPT